jgi:membrane protease YdiL (CAAX protease family)
MGRLRSTLAVAALWLIWHAPLFWLVADMRALIGPELLGWAAGLVTGAFVLAALYFATESILVVALWHTLFNFVVATPPGRGVPAAVISTVVMVCGGVVAVRWWRNERGRGDT